MLKTLRYTILVAALAASAAYAIEDKGNAQSGQSVGIVARPGAAEAGAAKDRPDAAVTKKLPAPKPRRDETMQIHGHYIVTAYDKHGNFKWQESFDNLVTTVGKNAMLDTYLAGSTWTTGTVYMMLKGTGSAAAGDTMASHAGWSELNITASSGIRQSVSWSAASSGSKAASASVSWSVTSSGTVAGCAIVVGGTSTNGNTTGTLYSAGDFTGGNRAVVNGDTLNVSYSTSL